MRVCIGVSVKFNANYQINGRNGKRCRYLCEIHENHFELATICIPNIELNSPQFRKCSFIHVLCMVYDYEYVQCLLYRVWKKFSVQCSMLSFASFSYLHFFIRTHTLSLSCLAFFTPSVFAILSSVFSCRRNTIEMYIMIIMYIKIKIKRIIWENCFEYYVFMFWQ